MIYFTSDWHIGHNKPFLYEPRGFSSIEEHDTAILLRCNELVGPEDELWILGDLALGQNEKEWNRVYKSLYCNHVHYVQGNHDTDNKMDKYDEEYFFMFHGYADMIKYSKTKRFYVSHYPTYTANVASDRIKVINLFGHTHSKEKFFNNNPFMYNVAADAHNCYPVSLEEIIKDIEKEVAKYEK